MIAKVRQVDYTWIQNSLIEIEKMWNRGADDITLILKIKELVPEFLSKNSNFENLDHLKVIGFDN